MISNEIEHAAGDRSSDDILFERERSRHSSVTIAQTFFATISIVALEPGP